LGAAEPQIGGLPPAPPLCRGLTPLQPPNGFMGGQCQVSYLKGTSSEGGTLSVDNGYRWGEATVIGAIAYVVQLKNFAF